MSDTTVPQVTPQRIAEALGSRVIGQREALRELSITLAKKLQGLAVGNVLMIGSSGTGKTTLMRAVEQFLAEHPELAPRWPLIRVHANVLAEESEGRRPGGALLERLLARARELAPEEDVGRLLDRARRGVVFVDEVDKIRGSVGGTVHTAGIRAQEALLTLIENEAVPFRLPDWAGGDDVNVDASDLLFVCAGAFEGLWDAVYDRVTVGADRGSLQTVSVVGDDGTVRQELRFALGDWLRFDDIFEYGMTPQFLARFDSVVLLHDLGEDDLVKIFLDSPESGYRQARDYFRAQGIELALSPAAVRRIAAEAAGQPRIGARALREVFRRVIRDYEYDPGGTAKEGSLLLDAGEVERALSRG